MRWTVDEPEDYELPIWAGIVPIKQVAFTSFCVYLQIKIVYIINYVLQVICTID